MPLRLLLVATALCLAAGCGPRWSFSGLTVLPDNQGQARLFVGETYSLNGPLRHRAYRGQIPMAGAAHRGDFIHPEDGVTYANSMGGCREIPGVVERYHSLSRVLADGTAEQVKVAEGVQLSEGALAQLASHSKHPVVWNVEGGARLLLHTGYLHDVWFYQIERGAFVGAMEVPVPEPMRTARLFTDPWSDPLTALYRKGEDYTTAHLECSDAACEWVVEPTTLAIAGAPSSPHLVRLQNGEPVVLGACPRGGCNGEGVPLIHSQGSTWIPFPDGVTEHRILATRALATGGLVVFARDTSDYQRPGVLVLIVADDYSSRAFRFDVSPCLARPLLMDEPGRGQVAHIVSISEDTLEDLHIQLSSGQSSRVSYPVEDVLTVISHER